MTDDPKKKRADGKRVALEQGHERSYLAEQAERGHSNALAALGYAQDAVRCAEMAAEQLEHIADRLRAGFPTTKGKRRGK